MRDIPQFFFENIHAIHHPSIQAWWQDLGMVLQDEIIHFWQHGRPDWAIGAARNINEFLLEKELFSPRATSRADEYELEFPNKLFYEYLINHEVYLDRSDGPLHFICTADRNIRESLLRGQLPVIKTCHLNRENCPMLAIHALRKNQSNDYGCL